jgi:hypothetical protein
MAHFASLDENNIVTNVIVIANTDVGEPTLSFPDTDAAGRAFIANVLKLDGAWKQTSINANFRGKYAGIGDRYDAELDEFVTPESEPTED